jgi:Fe2+ or Zn2+ uptake regulation protein
MDKRYGEISGMLKGSGMKSSHQRIKVIEYLSKNFCHPTADMVLLELRKELPTLSKSTVYKTLNALVAEGMLREITIDENEVRYEYNLHDHGHFKCLRCGRIYDFGVDVGSMPAKGLEGFKISDRNVYFKGICGDCIKNEENEK